MNPVVLLPSLGRPRSDFDHLVSALQSTGRKAVALDLPGVGDAVERPVGRTLHEVATDVVARIGGLPSPVHLIGHAYGNRVARCLAADHPDRVASLTLLGCGGKVPGDAEARDALIRCFTESPGSDAHRTVVATAFFAPGATVPPDWLTGWWPDAAAAQGAASEATPVEEWWVPPAPLPVLALVGENDRISPPANARDLIAQVGKRGRLVIVPAAGHALLPEQPEAVARALTERLTESD
jgi:pimeloyl-ACP methyl ester carboxylesterase